MEDQSCGSFPLLHKALSTAASDGEDNLHKLSNQGLFGFPTELFGICLRFPESGFLALVPCAMSSGIVRLPASTSWGGSHERRMVCSFYQAGGERLATCNIWGVQLDCVRKSPLHC